MNRLRLILLNVLYSLVAVGVAYLALSVDRFWPFMLPAGLEVLAWPLMAFGAALILWAAYTLLRHSGSTGAPGDPTRRLVTAGPYRWTRNPIYLGDGLLILGMAFFGRSPSLLLLDLVYLAGIDGYVRRVEEPAVERRFGRVYLAYRKDVPRWIPWRGQNNSAV